MPSYLDLTREIESIEGSGVIGHIKSGRSEFPFYMIKRGKGDKKVLLSGAVHGDEPAGTRAILEFFRYHSWEYENGVEFTAFPCVDPHGYRHNVRGNARD